MSKIIIDVWADITCPFCYIGEVLLARELTNYEHRELVEVRWRSYRLMPDLELGKSVRHRDMVEMVKDPAERARMEKKTALLRQLAEKYDLLYNVENSYPHNSYDAARLLKLATAKGYTLEVATVFGAAFFSQGLDLSDRTILRAKAIEAGFSAQEVDQLLDSDQYGAEVREDQVIAEKYVPRFVPTFYFNGDDMLEGIVTPEEIRDSLASASLSL